MLSYNRRTYTALTEVLLIAALVTMLLFAGTASAFATHASISVEDLDALLESNGGVLPAYMKTVLKGSTVVEISLEIIGITSSPSFMPAGFDSLVLFRSDDARLTKNGGIAQGMSGSPIYLGDSSNPQAGDLLVGALSYGDAMTLDNFGLATPIEAMRSIKSYPLPLASGTLLIDEPILSLDGVEKTHVIITDTPQDQEAATAEDAIVVCPMQAFYMSGMKTKSGYGKAYVEQLASKGIAIVGQGGGTGGTSTYDAPFEEGGSVAAMLSSGDFWVGAIGTVTEVEDGEVLAFGHPCAWTGDSQLFMSNAWVDGVWPSTYISYKLARAATDRGVILQDRAAGIFGVDGTLPAYATISATTTNADTGITKQSVTRIPRFVMDSEDFRWFHLTESAAYIALCKVTDAEVVRGSVNATTSATIRDGSDIYTVTLSNRWFTDDPDSEVIAYALSDLFRIVDEVASVSAFGRYQPQIIDVTFEATYTAAKNYGRITDVSAPTKGLQHGSNELSVAIERPGSLPNISAPVVLEIPDEFSLSGTLCVGSESRGDDDYFDDECFDSDERTVAEMIADLERRVPNTVIVVIYEDEDGNVVEVTTDPFDFAVTGFAYKETVDLAIALKASTIAYQGTATITGDLSAYNGKGKLELWQRQGSATTFTFVKNVPLTIINAAPDSLYAVFSTTVEGLTKNTTFQIRYTGSKYELPATSDEVMQNVRAGLALKASKTTQKVGATTKYTATVSPTGSKGKVVFQYHNGKKWVTFATKTVSPAGTATASRASKKVGTFKVRAQFTPSASTSNVKSAWVARNVKYKK